MQWNNFHVGMSNEPQTHTYIEPTASGNYAAKTLPSDPDLPEALRAFQKRNALLEFL